MALALAVHSVEKAGRDRAAAMSSSALLLLLGLPPLLLESSSAPTVTVSTVSTGTMALGFQERGELTAVVDIAGNRSLLLDSVRHTLLGIVLANQTAVTAPSAVSFDSRAGSCARSSARPRLSTSRCRCGAPAASLPCA